jgi:hypothetical protein
MGQVGNLITYVICEAALRYRCSIRTWPETKNLDAQIECMARIQFEETRWFRRQRFKMKLVILISMNTGTIVKHLCDECNDFLVQLIIVSSIILQIKPGIANNWHQSRGLPRVGSNWKRNWKIEEAVEAIWDCRCLNGRYPGGN